MSRASVVLLSVKSVQSVDECFALYTQWVDGSTVLWRLYCATGPHKGERASAVVLPGGPPFTLTFLVNDEMERVENYETIELARFRSDEIKRGLLEDDWKED